MNIETLPEYEATALRVAIGHELIKLLGLKQDNKTGYVQTSTGKKSAQGLGSSVIGILTDEFERLTK